MEVVLQRRPGVAVDADAALLDRQLVPGGWSGKGRESSSWAHARRTGAGGGRLPRPRRASKLLRWTLRAPRELTSCAGGVVRYAGATWARRPCRCSRRSSRRCSRRVRVMEVAGAPNEEEGAPADGGTSGSSSKRTRLVLPCAGPWQRVQPSSVRGGQERASGGQSSATVGATRAGWRKLPTGTSRGDVRGASGRRAAPRVGEWTLGQARMLVGRQWRTSHEAELIRRRFCRTINGRSTEKDAAGQGHGMAWNDENEANGPGGQAGWHLEGRSEKAIERAPLVARRGRGPRWETLLGVFGSA